jgi:leader peptidase (prepilin peptidase)/N-methyltransferase
VIEEGLAAGGVAAMIGATAALLVRPLLGRLPVPVPGDGRPVYRDLGTARFLLVCGALAGVAAAISWLSVPRYAQPMWSVLAILGVLLAAIDARTSWLPLQLTRTAWLAMAVATVLAASLGGGVWVAVRALAGAMIAGGLYLVVWLLSHGGFGFGDVRFAPLLGGAAAADSWTLLWWTLLLGTVAGGLIGLLRLAQGRRGAFPYAPSMLVGAYAACVVTVLS